MSIQVSHPVHFLSKVVDITIVFVLVVYRLVGLMVVSVGFDEGFIAAATHFKFFFTVWLTFSHSFKFYYYHIDGRMMYFIACSSYVYDFLQYLIYLSTMGVFFFCAIYKQFSHRCCLCQIEFYILFTTIILLGVSCSNLINYQRNYKLY